MESTALAKQTAAPLQPPAHSLADLQSLGGIFVKSGFFSDSKDAAQAIVKIMAGAELGFAPIASMTGVYIVKGKVSLSANLIAAAIKRSNRYNYRVTKLDDEGCAITFFEGPQNIGTSEFNREDAVKAGLMSENYKKFPRNMYFARALSNGAKWYCPDVFGGPIYTPDELGATVDGETGEVIDIPAEKPPAIAQESRQDAPNAPTQGQPAPKEKSAAQVDFEAKLKALKALGVTKGEVEDRIAELCDGQRDYGKLTEGEFAGMLPDFEKWENELHAARTERANAVTQ